MKIKKSQLWSIPKFYRKFILFAAQSQSIFHPFFIAAFNKYKDDLANVFLLAHPNGFHDLLATEEQSFYNIYSKHRWNSSE